MTLWPGSWLVRETFNEEEILKLKIKYPKADIIAHPECTEVLLQYADFIGSTSKLLKYSQSSSCCEFIVLTEPGIIHQMQKKEPNKIFYDVPGLDGCSCNECPYMRLNTAEKVISSLENMSPEIILDNDIRTRAMDPIIKMLEMSN